MRLEIGQTPEEERLENAFATDMQRVLAELYNQPLQNGLIAQEADFADWTLNYYDNRLDLLELLSGVLSPYMIGAFNIGGQLAIEHLGIDGAFALRDDDILDEIDEAVGTLATIDGEFSLLTTTANELDRQLSAADLASDAFGVITALAAWIAGRSLFRSRSIAETESVRLSRQGLLHAYEKNGVLVAIHRTQEDNRVCPICSPLNGNEYRLGINGRLAMIPSSERIPLHTKCRCFYDIGERTETDEDWLGG